MSGKRAPRQSRASKLLPTATKALHLTAEDLRLTAYDLLRKPRGPLVTDADATITIPYKTLNAEMQCPVCMSVIRQASIVVECLHRFCRECIHKCLRLGKKECPACRTHVPSRRSCRPDPAFDLLIRKFYPNLDEFEAKEAAAISATNRRDNFNSAFTQSVEQGVKAQLAQRKRVRRPKVIVDPAPPRKPKTPARAATRSRAEGAASGAGGGHGNGNSRGRGAAPGTGARSGRPALKRAAPPASPSEESSQPPAKQRRSAFVTEPVMAQFALRRHPHDTGTPVLEKPWLRTSRVMPIASLKKYLRMKLSLPTASFEVSVLAEGSLVTVADSVTIGQLHKQLNLELQECVELQYRRKGDVARAVAAMPAQLRAR